MTTHEESSADDIMIAADLTLYQNPLSTALNAAKVATLLESRKGSNSTLISSDLKPDSTQGSSSSTKEEDEENEWIASDMTKYDSPLADLERETQLRSVEEKDTK